MDKRVNQITERWPTLKDKPLIAWAQLAELLQIKKQTHDAYLIAQSVLELSEPNSQEALLAQRVITNPIPKWHWPMVKDKARNTAYLKAIERAVTPGSTVLDIGCGSGLLSMMAARAGARQVLACEMEIAVANIAQEIVKKNGFENTITVVAKHSKQLNFGTDLTEPVDILVSEIIGNNLLMEDVLEVHRDVVPRLLKPGGIVIPASISVIVALGYCSDWDNQQMLMVEGFDLSPFNQLMYPHKNIAVGSKSLTLQSTQACLYSFNLSTPSDWPSHQATATVRATGQPVNAICQWVRLTMDHSGASDSVYENHPAQDPRHHWAVGVHRLNQKINTYEGQAIAIGGKHNEKRLLTWIE